VPVAIRLVVPKLPVLAFPDTSKLVSIPVLVIFGCAAVVNAPLSVVAITPVAPKLPTLAFPVAFSVPDILAPVLVITNTF
jgi:hypothetical protein